MECKGKDMIFLSKNDQTLRNSILGKNLPWSLLTLEKKILKMKNVLSLFR